MSTKKLLHYFGTVAQFYFGLWTSYEHHLTP